ncbi:BAG family molecular chaperone regulator 5 [Dissostichus eleginoides]|uniref:BAG family molecular chaperone regulator 5 n=1 Tax=Dissostichus eleginoides TaxID=100907 RepID=A0AAD9C553_DISEL|nr:BAG family molecular chaperone regulator 5 [Dissostichus eleginoides]
MDHGAQQHQQHHPMEQQQQSYHQQHPAMMRLYEVQKEVQSLGSAVCTFSGLQHDRDYKRVERELTRLLLEVDKVDTEGKPELQGARKRAAQEVEGLLRYLEENATHPSRIAIEDLSNEARQLVDDRVVAPQRSEAWLK